MNNFFRTIIYLFVYHYLNKIGFIFYDSLRSNPFTSLSIISVIICIICLLLSVGIIYDISRRMK